MSGRGTRRCGRRGKCEGDAMAFDDFFGEADAVANDFYAHATEFAPD
jgi:hypothetical protein